MLEKGRILTADLFFFMLEMLPEKVRRGKSRSIDSILN
jgi:hypothetical protein